MATDGPTPVDCARDIFENGQSVAALDASSNAAENWVQAVAKRANARVDWHYSGGVVHVLHLGDEESRTRVENAVTELESSLKGTLMRRYAPKEAGLMRGDVTAWPEGAIAVVTTSGENEFIG